MQQPILKSINCNSEKSKEISDVLSRISTIELMIQEARDIAGLCADLGHELPESTKAITVDAQALRGVMTRLCARMDDAKEMLGTVQTMVSLFDENSES
jgi:hypothetical protein